VAVKHEQAVVLGGLIEDNTISSQGGVPGLHKVPVIGWAFGQKQRDATRRELVVVLTPKVIANEQDIEAVNKDFKRRLKGLEGRF
jgi:general secretion pathway protein D